MEQHVPHIEDWISGGRSRCKLLEVVVAKLGLADA